MKNIMLSVAFTLVFSGCFFDNTPTEEECKAQGLVLKQEMKLNYRSGKYEKKIYCAKR